MTRGLEEALNLPHLEDLLKEQDAPKESLEREIAEDPENEVPPEAVAAMNKASHVLARGAEFENGRDHADDMEKLHDETLKHSRDLMDLGFNVDVRSARGIFEVAASMYKNAIDAKNSKRDAQLKLMKLMLDKRKLDLQERQMTGEGGTVVSGEGLIIEDRNELIRQLREAAKRPRE